MRTPASFDRWQPHGGDTLAYRLLRNDIAHINTFCWNGYGVVNHAQRTLALSSQEGPVSTILHYGKDPGHRSNTPIAEVQAQLHDVDNWMRLAVVVFCASCLELFIRRIVRLALQSDPGLLLGSSKLVDGVRLLKSGSLPDVDAKVKACTEDVWSKREHAIATVFLTRVDAIYENLADLEFLRELLNSVSHDVARKSRRNDLWHLDPEQAEPLPIEKMKPEKIERLFRVVDQVASALEERARGHIGAFEIMYFWHSFLGERGRPRNSVIERYIALFKEGAEAKLLSTFHHRMVGGTLSRAYCNGLIRYYNRA